MKISIILLAAFSVANLAACTSAEERKDEAQAGYTEEKTQTLQDYKKCVSESSGDSTKLAQCDALLKAVSAVEGGGVDDSSPAAVTTPATAPAATPVAAPAAPVTAPATAK